MKRNEDILWKGILEDAFDDFLRFIDPEAERLLDLERGFDFLDKELLQEVPSKGNRHSSKIVDKLVKVYTKNGQEEYILVHVEVQGKYQKDFGKRMFTFYYHLFDKYNKHITAYAIFTEANTIERPNFFTIELLSTSLLYTFKTYKIANQKEEELLASNNPFALVVLAAKTVLMSKKIKDNGQRDQQLLAVKTNLVKQLLSKGLNKEKVRIIMNFINYYINFDSNEINIKF
ncbi:hypothetical protein [Pedobacter sp. L105]|uniref:hypothetical protein n=1 Tax=Pedobacter sp. L105 TaxID=1641871 RepID=UPI00131B6964|nr:hypothetical protein [Pedobacter sp. L105]